MRFHLPKPLHGWREFAGEVGVIVLGVLIALGFQQLAEAWNWSGRVSDGRQALRHELAVNFLFAEERLATTPCMLAQLDTLKGAVLAANGRMTPRPVIVEPPFEFVYRSPYRPWRDSAWRAAGSDGVLEHFPAQERAGYDSVYTQIEMLSRRDEQSLQRSGQLMSLANALPVDPAVQSHYIEIIESERQDVGLMEILAGAVIDQARELGGEPPSKKRRDFLANVSGTVSYCRTHPGAG